ncbi:hypothetical protein WJX73_000093 [Symbiochloris irregularis]|uniref:tetrahydrofolate synthase n=1 Tax=Symbiochloris irregularis TaxID=706552 RepID=A0AAW1NRG8_9CHLO
MSEWTEALDALDTLISGKPRSDGGVAWKNGFDMMRVYLQRLSIDTRLKELSVIHVAGTKGKGSTCAFVESMLRSCGYRTGLYTSPHLCDVRERIAINGEPISKEVFLKHFWPTYDTLSRLADGDAGKPAYFRFLTLLGLQVFLAEKVDVVILEVGLGGRLDATNCVQTPVVCGVSSLGFDHMELLGNTLREIATEKAGIFKPGCPAFTSPQLLEAMTALQMKADAVGTPLQQAATLDTFTDPSGGPITTLGLAGQHQQSCRWPGRSQVVEDRPSAAGTSQPSPSQLTFFIDGAHTPESMTSCGQWFGEAANAAAADSSASHAPPSSSATDLQRVLLFHCMKARDPDALLSSLATALQQQNLQMDHALQARRQICHSCPANGHAFECRC